MLNYLLLWDCDLEAVVSFEINDRVNAIITPHSYVDFPGTVQDFVYAAWRLRGYEVNR